MALSDVRPALTGEQEAFVDAVLSGRNVLVDACVGSGKTTAIQELCRRASGKRILYLTYNKLLKLDARDRIRMPGVQVQNYHGFAWAELARNGIRPGVSDIMPSYLAAKVRPDPVDLLVLDEYQDINGEIADMLSWLRRCLPGMQVAAVGDMRQKLYDWTRLDVAAFVSDYLGRDRLETEFTTCFRLSPAHAAALGGAWGRSIVGTNADAEVRWVSEDEAFDAAAACEPRDLLVLGKKSGDGIMDLLNQLEATMPGKFNKYTIWAKIMDHDGGATQPTPECAVFTTYDGSKGMERDTCIVFDFTKGYWDQRLYPETADPEIVRNIFLVAASRGKRRILFVDPGTGRRGEPLDFAAIGSAPGKQRTRKRLFDISSMLDFKFAEDVDACFEMLEVRKLDPPGEPVRIGLSDGMIDLSPCVGIWAEASYFSGYDIDKAVARSRKVHDGSVLSNRDVTGWGGEELILYDVALETGQARYVSQVSGGWVPPEAGREIHARLARYLPEDALVQVPCGIAMQADGYGPMELDGVCDVFYDRAIWELKFTAALTAVHAVQLGGYLLASDVLSGMLYNIRTGERWEVRIRDRDEFATRLAVAATKGIAGKVRQGSDRDRVRSFAAAHPNAFREMEARAASGAGAVAAYLEESNLAPPVPAGRMMKFFRTAGGSKKRGIR